MSSGVLSFYRSGETRRAAIGNVLFGEPSFVSVNVSLHKKELRTSVTYSRNSQWTPITYLQCTDKKYRTVFEISNDPFGEEREARLCLCPTWIINAVRARTVKITPIMTPTFAVM